ncbi:hypothetical protein ABB37_00352 [Leptomonas pyrrhocoris]|uniref:Leucine-rich repeat protein (LRRP) n=1 Tax=Leptomonas pyrrhocoris TaxID=157538 RepID=A0A0M9GAJ5_LEPPY|nr:hypothetical protein ABB37_00352 [Leptomonas pyrrhocoris]XP_015664526.1 hypothetical protein ABB37_00352 [Leptomonas pyrrhocoris]KPA86086.1 hypothetical protein ABB37_00352 [Leptomonas pyrrhocoris]KPA86087.1 hypothetical protein ABB37_00352 [Leptomonas pyrrhocoris]|eukprot:XP_015664525.1 hypothetical protein ABB37_00352 [Leptomonas pyrrhocoris]
MELNLSNRGLFSFDAAQARQSWTKTTRPTNRSSSAAPASMEGLVPVIRQLNLAFNSLHIFTGGETLRGLAVLDLSHNALTQLRGHSLPATLVKLNLSHNRLAQLAQLAGCTPRLQELDVGHNQLSASALRGLPVSLTQLNVESNVIESLAPFTALLHLSKLNVAENQLESSDTLQSLRPLLSLRFLDLRGNPICEKTGPTFLRQPSRGSHNSSITTTTTTSNVQTAKNSGEPQSLLGILNTAVPRLSHLNGLALSQAPENRMLKSGRAEQARKQGRSTSNRRDASRSGSKEFHRSDSSQRRGTREVEKGGGDATDKSYASSSCDASATRPALEVRLMQAKVSELRRLLLAAQDTETKARQERSLLTENVKRTAVVIDQQGAELEKLQEDIARLREEELQLRVPIAAAEESFEQVHASLLATKAKASAASVK